MCAEPPKIFDLLTPAKIYFTCRPLPARRLLMPSCPSKQPHKSRVVTKNAMVSAKPTLSEASTQTGECPLNPIRHRRFPRSFEVRPPVMLRTAPNLSDAIGLVRTNTDSDVLCHACLAGPTEPMVQVPVEVFRHRLVTGVGPVVGTPHPRWRWTCWGEGTIGLRSSNQTQSVEQLHCVCIT